MRAGFLGKLGEDGIHFCTNDGINCFGEIYAKPLDMEQVYF